MGKRQRSDYRGDGDASSTESNDETLLPGKMNGGETCSHIQKSIDLNTIRKQIKANDSWFRKTCSKCRSDLANLPSSGKGTADSADSDTALWLCLKCGSQLCGRGDQQHALEHYTTPRSDMHSLAMNTSTFDVWCYSCNLQVDAYAKPKLLDIFEFVKREATKVQEFGTSIDSQVQITTESVRKMMIDVLQSTPVTASYDVPDAARLNDPDQTPAAAKGNGQAPGAAATTPVEPAHVPSSRITVDMLPRVRGLSNLGNTCFFNAVLQCLARTPYLLPILKQSASPGERVYIPGGTVTLPNGGQLIAPPIDDMLDGWRSLTEALAELLTELNLSAPSNLSPNRLLQELTSKWPQFDGGDQHDSHELLRHLLESVRTDDLRRYQALILQHLGLDKPRAHHNVDHNQKALVRFYGDQISQWVFRPEQVFRGSLVSTLTCQECQHTSSQHEYFLDISLPVCVEKPQPPVRRRTSPEPTEGATGPSSSVVARSASSKKERERDKKAKRIAKHQKNRINLSSTLGGPATAGDDLMVNMVPLTDDRTGTKPKVETEVGAEDDEEEDGTGGGDESSDDSDADVEDNDDGVDVDQNGNQSQSSRSLPEKLDDTPENPDKEPDGAGNVVCSVGISAQRAARMARQLSGGTGAGSETDERDQQPRRGRQRTVSHADWSNTVAPRYQCEDGEYSVQSCLNNFTAVELMTGNNKVCCEACTERINGPGGRSVNTNATKQFLVSQPPAVLILHLKRFQVGLRGVFKKLNKPVAFPFVLDIAPFCGSKVKRASHIRPGQRQILYALYGLVEHTGSMHGGHYVAYVKVRPPFPDDDQRWKFIPHGTKDELDRKSEQEMAKEQALRMGVHVRDSDDSLSSGSDRDVRPNEPVPNESDGAVGYTPPQPDVEMPPGKWYCVSDGYVREVSEEVVLKAQAYLLFYERIF